MNPSLQSTDTLQQPSSANSAGGWIKETRLLKQLETVKKALEDAYLVGAVLPNLFMIFSVVAVLPACGLLVFKFTVAGVIVGILSVFFAVLAYSCWPVEGEKKRKVEDAINALGGEFPDELREWGGDPALRSEETVDFLIRTQRAKIAQAEDEAYNSFGSRESRPESRGHSRDKYLSEWGKWWLIWGVVAFVFMLIIVPWTTYGSTYYPPGNAGYSIIFDPPQGSRIDFTRMFLPMLADVIITIFLIWASQEKPKNSSDTKSAEA